MNTLKPVSHVLKSYVASHHLSVTDLARETGISPVAITRSLAGKRRFTADELIQLMDYLNLEISDFYSGNENQRKAS